MKFTEHEMTTAVTAVAKFGHAVANKTDDVDAAWEGLDRFSRYQMLAAIGERALPVLVALPEVTIEPGTRAEYEMETIAAAVNEVLESKALNAAAQAGTEPAEVDPRLLTAHTLLVAEVLNQMPVRRDADGLLRDEDIDDEVKGFVVPDDLSGL